MIVISEQVVNALRLRIRVLINMANETIRKAEEIEKMLYLMKKFPEMSTIIELDEALDK